MLRISDYREKELPGNLMEVSAMLGTEHLWYRLPTEWPIHRRGEPFLAAALLPGMATGQRIRVEDGLPVDQEFLAGLNSIQQVFRHWGRSFRQQLRTIPIDCSFAPAPRPTHGVGTFFSGGIDGTFTFLELKTPPDHAVFVRGVDFQLDNPVYDAAFEQNRRWLSDRGVPLVSMSSNVRWVLRSFGIGWNTGFGAGLASFAHLLGFGTTYVASGHTWSELWPDGSHPVTDHLWSSSSRKLVHHGRGHRRWQKLERIAREPGALDILRVCWMDQGYNCGRCEKCLRTMVLLRLLKLEAPHFPPLADLGEIARLAPSDRSEARFVEEAIELAVDRGDRPVERALRRSLGGYRLRRLLGDFDRGFLRGGVKRLRKRQHMPR